jgi:hypothetical protein
MKKGFLYGILFLFPSFTCFAQHPLQKYCDSIFLYKGKVLIGKISRVDEDFVYYKLQKNTNKNHWIGLWRVSYVKTAKGEKLVLPRSERYSTTLKHHPDTSPLDKDSIVLKSGRLLVGKVVNIDDCVHYTMANDKRYGYKVAKWKVDYIKYSSGKFVKPTD